MANRVFTAASRDGFTATKDGELWRLVDARQSCFSEREPGLFLMGLVYLGGYFPTIGELEQ